MKTKLLSVIFYTILKIYHVAVLFAYFENHPIKELEAYARFFRVKI